MKFSELKTKKARIQFIREKLGSDAAWAVRGLVRVFENQTADEQCSDAVSAHNGIGFTVHDAEFLSKLAKFYIQHGRLSDKQMGFVFNKMPKYARQLEDSISN